jgi:hypothetical protein
LIAGLLSVADRDHDAPTLEVLAVVRDEDAALFDGTFSTSTRSPNILKVSFFVTPLRTDSESGQCWSPKSGRFFRKLLHLDSVPRPVGVDDVYG